MSDIRVIETQGDLRVRIERDEHPIEPYDDGMAPIVDLDNGEQLRDLTSYRVPDQVEEACGRWADDPDVLERYLRIFHGATTVQWFDSDHRYVAFDTAHWRKAVGITDGLVQIQTEDLFSDWRAYCEGDAWVTVVEERVDWQRVGSDEMRETWEAVEIIGGYYGEEYAEEAARDALRNALTSRANLARATAGGGQMPLLSHDPRSCTDDHPCALCANKIAAREWERG